MKSIRRYLPVCFFSLLILFTAGSGLHSLELSESEEALQISLMAADGKIPDPASYALVGKEGYEFNSLQKAVDGAGRRRIIIIMDPVLTESGIVINRDISVIGFGPDATVLQAAETSSKAPDRVLTVAEGTSVYFYGITIANGRPAAMLRRGGGILNFGSLEMEACSVRDNQALYGAGIFTDSRLIMKNCLISGNSTVRAPSQEMNTGLGCNGSGGGLKTEKGAEVFLYGCTIMDNSSFRRGGGLYIACESDVYMENCTVSGNSSIRAGAGINSRGNLSMVYCTVAYNDSGKNGGGIYNYGYLNIAATILAYNSVSDFESGDGGQGYYGKGILDINIYNLSSDGSLPGSIQGDPRLKPLSGSKYGPPVHRLKLFSPALRQVPAETFFSTDILDGISPLPETDQSGRRRSDLSSIGSSER